MCKSEIPTSKCSAARTKKRKTCKKIATLHALYPSKLCLTRRVINELTAGLKVRRQEVLHNTSVYLIMVAKVDFRRWYTRAMRSIHAQCLKVTEKVSFNIASEESYDYIMSRQKFIKNAKNGLFKPETYGETVFPDRSLFNRTTSGEKCLNWKFQMRHFW